MGFRISVDTGGTFTDVVVADETGVLHLAKAPTDARARLPEHRGRAGAARARLRPHRAGAARADGRVHVRHHARHERDRRGPNGAHRVLHDGGVSGRAAAPRGREAGAVPAAPVPAAVRSSLPDLRDPGANRLRGRRLRPAGRGERPRRAIAEARRLGAEAVAVCLLWSIVNPAHELRVGELLEREWPGVAFTLSHRLNPIIREYRRASSTAIDASLKPLMQEYLSDDGARSPAGRPRRPHLRRHVVRRRLAAAGGRRAADLLRRLRTVDGPGGGADVRAGRARRERAAT